jgi:two-component system, LytTR family, response regulator
LLDNRLNILIVDDELNAREFLQKLIVRHFKSRCEHIDTAYDVSSAKNFLIEKRYDIVFLDIQLGKENGFDLLKQFATRNFEVVFTTAHKEYALNAIKESAFDYILKPINYIDLLSVFKKIEQQKLKDSLLDRLYLLNTKLSPLNHEYTKIAFPTKDGMKLVHLADIMYCSASGSYSDVILSNNSKITVSKPLKYFEDVLPEKLFFRCHKSFFVNLNYADSYNDANKQIILTQGTEIPVSVRKKEAFIHAIARK